MRLPYWLRGGFLGIAYVSVIFLIKATCVPEWCFADIFLPLVFAPLTLSDYFLSNDQIIFIGQNLFTTTLVVWFVIGMLVGIIYSAFPKKNKPILGNSRGATAPSGENS